MDLMSWWPALDRVGYEAVWVLVTVLWQSSILLAAAGLIAWALRRRRPSVRHVLWAAALLAAPLLPLLGWIATNVDAPQAEIPVMPDYPAHRPPAESAEPVVAPSERPALPMTPALPIAPAPEAATEPAPPRAEGPFSILAYPWALALLAYAAGAGALLALVLAGRLRIAAWVRGGRVVTDREALAVFRSAKRRLGLAGDVLLVESDPVRTPMAVGLLRPVVLLPAGFARELSASELEAVALHELAHIKRRDPLVLTVLSLVRAALFFHPLVWLACRQVSRLAEAACDDAVLDATAEPVSYAKLLARLAEALPRRAVATELASGFVLSKGAFLARIRAILSDRRDQIRRFSRIALAVTALACVISVILALALPLGESSAGKDRDEDASAGLALAFGDEARVEVRGLARVEEGRLVAWRPNGKTMDAEGLQAEDVAPWGTVAILDVDRLDLRPEARSPAGSVVVPMDVRPGDASRRYLVALDIPDGQSSCDLGVVFRGEGWTSVSLIPAAESQPVIELPPDSPFTGIAVLPSDDTDRTVVTLSHGAGDGIGRDERVVVKTSDGTVHDRVSGSFSGARTELTFQVPRSQVVAVVRQRRGVGRLVGRGLSLRPDGRTQPEVDVHGAVGPRPADPPQWGEGVRGDLDLLRRVAAAWWQNRRAIRTWRGTAVAVDRYRSDGERSRTDRARRRVEFVWDRARATKRWNWTLQQYESRVDGRPGPEVTEKSASGMLTPEAFYKYRRMGTYADGRPVRMLMVWPVDFARPDWDRYDFDPTWYMSEGGRDVAATLLFFVREACSPQLGPWQVTRDGDLVTVEHRGDSLLNRYVFHLSKGGNLTDYRGRGTYVKSRRAWAWEQRDGVWLPETYVWSQTAVRADGSSSSWHRQLTFIRSEINVPVTDADFALERLGIKDGDRVQNHFTGERYTFRANSGASEAPALKSEPPVSDQEPSATSAARLLPGEADLKDLEEHFTSLGLAAMERHKEETGNPWVMTLSDRPEAAAAGASLAGCERIGAPGLDLRRGDRAEDFAAVTGVGVAYLHHGRLVPLRGTVLARVNLPAVEPDRDARDRPFVRRLRRMTVAQLVAQIEAAPHRSSEAAAAGVPLREGENVAILRPGGALYVAHVAAVKSDAATLLPQPIGRLANPPLVAGRPALELGPVREAVIPPRPRSGANPEVLLDFETANVAELPPELHDDWIEDERERWQWKRRNGFDLSVIAYWDISLLAQDAALVEADNAVWNEVTASDLQGDPRLKRLGRDPFHVPAEEPLPRTFLFRTREGAWGEMRLAERLDGGGVRVLYRLAGAPGSEGSGPPALKSDPPVSDQEPSATPAEPRAAIAEMETLKALFGAADVALMEKDDPEAAREILDSAMPQVEAWQAKLAGTQAESTAAAAVGHVKLIRQALHEGKPEKAKALMEGFSAVGQRIEDSIRRDAAKGAAAGSTEREPPERVGGGGSFGPVIERVVKTEREGSDFMIDLDTGRLATPPEDLVPDDTDPDDRTAAEMAAGFTWLTEQGVDALAMRSGTLEGLLGVGLRAAHVHETLWRTATPQQVAEAVGEGPGEGPPQVVINAANGARTFAFRTREGGTGILQITGFSDKPEAVRIRYKLVQGAAAEGAAAPPAIERPGESPWSWGEPVNGLQAGLRVRGVELTPKPKVTLEFALRRLGGKPRHVVRVLGLAAQKRFWGDALPMEVRMGGKVLPYNGPVLEPPPPPPAEDFLGLVRPSWTLDSVEAVMNPEHWGLKGPSGAEIQFIFSNTSETTLAGPYHQQTREWTTVEGLWVGRVTSGTVSVEAFPAKVAAANDVAWGEAVEGVQVRLRAGKREWPAGAVPTLKADVRNKGKRDLLVWQTQALAEVEVDGKWFAWQGEIAARGSWFPPGKGPPLCGLARGHGASEGRPGTWPRTAARGNGRSTCALGWRLWAACDTSPG
jgi:beta-lactamase regulating signal transducer with metallopeptidase domain